MPFGLEELLELLGEAPELVDLTEGGFDIGQLGGLVDEGFDIGQLGGDVFSQLTEFDADPDALAGLQRLIDAEASRDFPDAVSRAMAATARGGTTSLLQGFKDALDDDLAPASFRLPDIRVEATPDTEPVAPPLKAEVPTSPALDPFKPLAMESPAPRPEVGLDRLLAAQRGAQEYLPESQRRLGGRMGRVA